jgi:hypothetical protein
MPLQESSLHNLGLWGFVSGRGFSRAESLSQEHMAFRPWGEFEGLAEFVSGISDSPH